MPTPGSTELLLDQLLGTDVLDRRSKTLRQMLDTMPIMRRADGIPVPMPWPQEPVYADTRVSSTTTKSSPLTAEVFEKALREIGLVSPRPGMVLGATVTAHPLAFAVLGRALEEARVRGLEIEDWKLLQILSASLTHLDVHLGMKPSCAPSEAAR